MKKQRRPVGSARTQRHPDPPPAPPDLSPEHHQAPPASGDGATLPVRPAIETAPEGKSTPEPGGFPLPPLPWGDAYPPFDPAAPYPMQPPPLFSRGGFWVGLFVIVVTVALGAAYLWPDAPGRRPPTAQRAALTDGRTDAAAPAGGQESFLSVVSAPGATVAIDFDSVGVTPLQKYALESGAYVVSLSKPGYAPLDTVVFVQAGAHNTVYLPLAPESAAPAEIAGIARPPVATHAHREAPPAAAHREAGDTSTRHTASADDTGKLLVTSEPSGGTLYLDGTPQGNTPLLIPDVTPGSHAITIRHDGFAAFTTHMEVAAGSTATVVAPLEALSGTVTILVQPWGSIYIDGKLRSRDTDVQYQTDLPIGAHHVRVVHPTLGTWDRTIDVAGGTVQNLFVTFQQTTDESTAQPTAQPAH